MVQGGRLYFYQGGPRGFKLFVIPPECLHICFRHSPLRASFLPSVFAKEPGSRKRGLGSYPIVKTINELTFNVIVNEFVRPSSNAWIVASTSHFLTVASVISGCPSVAEPAFYSLRITISEKFQYLLRLSKNPSV